MAYSRWDRSRWFVFGTSKPDAPAETQELSIHDSGGRIFEFSFAQLKENLDTVLKEIGEATKASDAEIIELRGYVSSFMRDVANNTSASEFNRNLEEIRVKVRSAGITKSDLTEAIREVRKRPKQ